MEISVFDTPEQAEFKREMLDALAEARQLLDNKDLSLFKRGAHWYEMALWHSRYDCDMADVYTPEDVLKQARVWAWLIFMNETEFESFQGFNKDWKQYHRKTHAMILSLTIRTHEQLRDKFECNCAYEAAEWHQAKINDAEWMLFQECN